MANRRNFDRQTRVAIVKRATRPDGQPACENCGAIGCKLEIHHINQDAMVLAEDKKKRKLTAEDGKLLCEPCHDAISKQQAPVLAKVLRVEARHLGVRTAPVQKIKSAPFPTSDKAAKREPRTSLPPRKLYAEIKQ